MMGRTKVVLFASVLVALLLGAVGVSRANAAFGLEGFSVVFTGPGGAVQTQAGSHPFQMTTSFDFKTFEEAGSVYPDQAAKDLFVNTPPGFVGDVTAVPQCPSGAFAERNPLIEELPNCSNDTAVGVVSLKLGSNTTLGGSVVTNATYAVYNVAPGPGFVNRFGFRVTGNPVIVDVGLSQKPPYEPVALAGNITQQLTVHAVRLTLWGDPADPAHDPYRGSCLKYGTTTTFGEVTSLGNCPVSDGVANKPFLTLPRSCHGPLVTTYAADSWQRQGPVLPERAPDLGNPAWVSGGTQSAATTGCPGLGFRPTIKAKSTNDAASSPTGLDFSLEVTDPGLTSPSGVANADIEKTEVTLPEEFSTNPAVAEGLEGCSEADLARETVTSGPGDGCPNASKIGTVEVESPLINEALGGSVFVAEPFKNRFHTLLALYLVIRNRKLGIIVKQPLKIEPDPSSGQLTAIAEEIPPLPFSHFELHFRDGDRSPLATPARCGDYDAKAKLYPGNGGAPVDAHAKLTVSSCPGAGHFAPHFQAGTTANAAGSYAPFLVHLTRRDGEPELTRISVNLPKGLTGRLAGLERCSDSAIAAARGKSGREELGSPSCPAGSAIGHVLAGAGVGPSLTYVSGTAYLGGPYLGAPFSVVVDTPAVAGPFDLGNVVVQEPLRVDPVTAQVSVDGAAGAPLPRILQGIRLHLRDLRIKVDRPGFTLNPTSCEPKQIGAGVSGAGPMPLVSGETLASIAVHYQAANCRALAFRPKVKLRLKGATKRAGHPALRAVVTYPKKGAYANIARAQVGLPHSEFLDQGNIGTVCTQAHLKSATCPKRSIYGRAKAWTPLLDKPLEGPVYLGVGYGHKLPDLVADLNGEVRILLNGRVDTTKHHGIRNTFEVVPDAPVSRFVLEMKGGKKFGLLENSENICRKTQRASARFIAQNGRVAQMRPRIANSCKRQRRRGNHHRHGKKRHHRGRH